MKFIYQLSIWPLLFSLVSCGGGGDTSTNNTVVEDTTPDAFNFIDQKGVALSTSIESNTITVSGVDSVIDISITGGEYSIDGGNYTATAGTVSNGQTIRVRHISSDSSSTITDTVLTVGSVSDTFTITTSAVVGDTTPVIEDTAPDVFSLIGKTEVGLSTVIESNVVIVSGIDNVTSISIIGGEYSINGGGYTAIDGTVSNGQAIKVRHTSSADFNTVTDTVLIIGGISDAFSSTTISLVQDVIPDTFSFIDQTGVALSTIIESNAIVVSGINADTSISIADGEYSIDGAGFTAVTGTVSNGQSIKVRLTSSISYATMTNAVLTMGGISDIFSVTTSSGIESLSIGNASIAEGNSGSTNLSFTVTLSGTAPGPVDVNYATSDGTATAGSDYTATSGTLTILSGTSAGSINVPITGDTVVEGDETFTLTLSNPANAILGSPTTATGTIINDDSALAVTATGLLNDTGITSCSDDVNNDLPCTQTLFPGQDAESGRDVTHNDDVDGHAGFSYSKIDSNGNQLSATATSWDCVLDNVTGLIWEVKTADGGLRDRLWGYSWYNSTGVNDAGDAGTANGGNCVDVSNCDTEKFVAAVNAVGLCGATDWRLPTVEELTSLVDSSIGGVGAVVDVGWFPNADTAPYWTSTPYALDAYYAWMVDDYVSSGYRPFGYPVRLVRGSL